MFLRYSDALDKGTYTIRLELYDFMAYLYDRVAVDFFQERGAVSDVVDGGIHAARPIRRTD